MTITARKNIVRFIQFLLVGSLLSAPSILALIGEVVIKDEHVFYDYNQVDFKNYSYRTDLMHDLFSLDDGRASKNVVLGVATPECMSQLKTPAFLGAQRHSGSEGLAVATLPKDQFPTDFEECVKIFLYRFATKLDNPSSSIASINHVDVNSWLTEMMHFRMDIKNAFEYPISIFWHEESHEPKQQFVVQPGETMNIGTFIGHVFSARKLGTDQHPNDADEIVDYFAAVGGIYTFSPMNRLETCDFRDLKFVEVPSEDSCKDLALRMEEYANSVWYQKRLGLNFVQPQLVPPVTDDGFLLTKLPKDTYKWLKEWYDEEKLRLERDEGPIGPCMNHHAAPPSISHLTPNEKGRLSDDLRPILEGWFGDKLEMTSIYGIRKYTNGSILRMHVDTVGTHVVSAIINVDQEVDVDWPLVILDHSQQEHKLMMRPGDMLLYESAKLLHGRPDRFVGSHYDNIFIHYRPVSGWDYSWL